jgi:membrane fusion protein (multidrug efflux system)
MKRMLAPLLALVIVLGVGAAYYVFVIRTSGGAPEQEATSVTPTATVTLATIERKQISETVTAYATVVAALGQTETFSVPFESRVRKISVAPGQPVRLGDPLATVEPSPDALLQLQQAQTEQKTARAQLDLVTQRVSMQLATEGDLVQAHQQLDAAQHRLDSMKSRGITDPETNFKASGDAVISRIDVQPGQIVAAGFPILESVPRDQIFVRVGVEPEDVSNLTVGQTVDLVPLSDASATPLQGHVRLVTQQVNPETRLIDVFVEPPAGSDLFLNEFVLVRIAVASADALVTPRMAVIPDQGRYIVFTVENGVAHRRVVAIGLENDTEVQVVSPDLHEGQQVALLGNAELTDGMAVVTGDAK